jgi:hypothetical protein
MKSCYKICYHALEDYKVVLLTRMYKGINTLLQSVLDSSSNSSVCCCMYFGVELFFPQLCMSEY